MKTFIILLLLAVTTSSALTTESPKECGANMDLKTSWGQCEERKCGEALLRACNKRLYIGPPTCFCAEGFYRHSDGKRCVKEAECLSASTESPKECGANMVLKTSWADCEELKCGDDELRACIKMFFTGPPTCFCAQGFRRHSDGKRCVKEAECFSAPTESPKECGENMVLKTSWGACEPYKCTDKKPRVCIKMFFTGPPTCFCAQGFVLHSDGKRCVTEAEC